MGIFGIFAYIHKVKKIFDNESATADFTLSEIVSAIVNLLDAKKELTKEEYNYVLYVYDAFNKIKDKKTLNKNGFIRLCDNIMAHFDLVAPYYKFCGDSKMKLLALFDSEKNRYRTRAKILLEKGAVFGDEWMELHKTFLKDFYPPIMF